MRGLLLLASMSMILIGCMTAADHQAAVEGQGGDRLTVGKVQREIRVGMSGADVVQVLGTPNIVSTDDQRREVWVYDRVSTDTAYSESRGGVAALILGGDVSVLGGAAGGAGARKTTQRTLTVVIKFDHEKRVRDFAYHASQF